MRRPLERTAHNRSSVSPAGRLEANDNFRRDAAGFYTRKSGDGGLIAWQRWRRGARRRNDCAMQLYLRGVTILARLGDTASLLAYYELGRYSVYQGADCPQCPGAAPNDEGVPVRQNCPREVILYSGFRGGKESVAD